jgi:hypothetical protein
MSTKNGVLLTTVSAEMSCGRGSEASLPSQEQKISGSNPARESGFKGFIHCKAVICNLTFVVIVYIHLSDISVKTNIFSRGGYMYTRWPLPLRLT